MDVLAHIETDLPTIWAEIVDALAHILPFEFSASLMPSLKSVRQKISKS